MCHLSGSENNATKPDLIISFFIFFNHHIAVKCIQPCFKSNRFNTHCIGTLYKIGKCPAAVWRFYITLCIICVAEIRRYSLNEGLCQHSINCSGSCNRWQLRAGF